MKMEENGVIVHSYADWPENLRSRNGYWPFCPSLGPTRRPDTEENIHQTDKDVKDKGEGKGEEEVKEESKEVITGLDAYMLRHTSEDNNSFEEIVEEGEKKRRIRW